LGQWRYEVALSLACAFVAVLGILTMLPGLLRTLTLVTSIELMKRPQHIVGTLHLMSERLQIACLQSLVSLRRESFLTRLIGNNARAECARLLNGFDHLSEIERCQADHAFDSCATSDRITEDAVLDCLKSCGINPPTEEVKVIPMVVTALCPDDDKIGGGESEVKKSIGRSEFRAMYMLLLELQHTPMDITNLRALFEEMDTNHNDLIDAQELHDTLSKHGAAESMSFNDCRMLIQEIADLSGHHGHAHDGQGGHTHTHHGQGHGGGDSSPKSPSRPSRGDSSLEDTHEDHGHEHLVEVSLGALLKWLKRLEERLHIRLVN